MSNVIVLDSSDEEDPPPKRVKTYSVPTKQKIQILNQRQNVQQQQQPFKKMQNSIQITPIYNNNSSNNLNNNNNNSIKNNQNKLLKNQLDKINLTSINTIGDVTINKTTTKTINSTSLLKPQIVNNNNNNSNKVNINRLTNSPINELNSLKTINKHLINNSTTTTTIPINLPNSIKDTITVKRINSPVSKINSNPLPPLPPITTGGLTIRSVNIPKQQILQQQIQHQQQQQKKELIDPLKLPATTNQLQKITISNNNNSNDEILQLNKLPIKRKLSEKTNFEKNLEQQIAQRQQKPPTSPSPQKKRIKPITISNKIDRPNWLNNNQSPVITIDDDDDDDDDDNNNDGDNNDININTLNSIQLSSKPFSVKLNNSYIQNISSPIDAITIKHPISSINSKISSTITTKSITHTIPSPIEISTNNDNIDKNDNNNLPLPLTSSASTTPNSKQNDDDNDNIIEKNPITPIYEELLKICREADPSKDMELLIDKKLLKYYHSVHPDFVTSKGFRKTIELTINEIKNTPELVYLKLKTIVEELKTRRKSKQSICNNEEHTTTGDSRKDDLVRKLNRGLFKLQMMIKKLEEDDVDFDNDSNSPYLKAERYKKRACEIYEKICDLTGESKHAHRLVSKPITFQGTSYPPFNKTIQTFVNRTKSFPDYLDIYRLLEFCNKQNAWDMSPEEMKIIAQDAFIKIGKLLQKRRQTDLYETVMHFTGNNIDPAENDTELNAKLLENQKHITKISSVLEKFSKQQDMEAAERQKTKDDKKDNSDGKNDDKLSEKSDNENKENEILKLNELETSTSATSITTGTTTTITANIPNNNFNEHTDDNSKLNSLKNPQPSTSKCSSEIKIHSVQSLRNNNINHNIVGEIILSDDDEDDET